MTNKQKHGGKREGAGRKPSPFISKRLVLHLKNEMELEYILEATGPRERTEILLKYLDMLPNSFTYLFRDEIDNDNSDTSD